MPELIDQMLRTAVQHQQAGRLMDAERMYRQVLGMKSDSPDALHLLGMVCAATARSDEGLALIQRAIAVRPAAEFYYNLGITHIAQDRQPEGLAAFQQAIKLKPDLAQAHFNIGAAQHRLRQLNSAAEAFRRALSLKPNWADAHRAIAAVYRDLGNPDQAIAAFRQAALYDPDSADAHYNLGLLLAPQFMDEAIVAFRRVTELAPRFVPAYNHLSIYLMIKGRSDEAIAACKTAIALDPNLADPHITLSNAMKDQGRQDESLAALRRVMELQPNASHVGSNIVFITALQANTDAGQIFSEATAWAARHTVPLESEIFPHNNNRTLDRKLRIGYVSADFTNHPVGIFMLPAMSRHDREKFEVHCFSNVDRSDNTTAWFRQMADRWHDVRSLSDAQCAELIHREMIDILIDLSLHTTGNRLLVLARKPAPVQATYLAYCGTSGMKAIDYLLTDPYLLPVGSDESNFSERPIRLARSYWCYRPWDGVPEVGPLPAKSAGYITFGSLNNFSKVTTPALHAWRQILVALPGSRLILHAKQGSHRQRVLDTFAEVSIDPGQIAFVGHRPAIEYFASHNQIDIALDPFPFAGGTTTCDALWMGVPVISLAGSTPVSRGGLSILSNIGLPELVASSTDEYIRLAVDLATDLPRLVELRATLRDRMQASPLMDEVGFVADLETAYRSMWATWCAQQTTSL